MKKNNLFKISLLLLVLNPTIIKPDEILACRDGVKNRNGVNGLQLITDSSQISGNGTPVNTIRLKAAWIFGYNSNIGSPYPSSDGKSWIPGNGGLDFYGNTGNNIEGIDVCDYGASIGWALNDDGSNTLNFYRDYGMNVPFSQNKANYLLYYLWGSIFGSHLPYYSGYNIGVRNNLDMIHNNYTIQGGFSNPGVLSSGYSNGYPNATNSINTTEADGIKCINPNNTYGDGSGNGGNGCDQG